MSPGQKTGRAVSPEHPEEEPWDARARVVGFRWFKQLTRWLNRWWFDQQQKPFFQQTYSINTFGSYCKSPEMWIWYDINKNQDPFLEGITTRNALPKDGDVYSRRSVTFTSRNGGSPQAVIFNRKIPWIFLSLGQCPSEYSIKLEYHPQRKIIWKHRYLKFMCTGSILGIASDSYVG